MHRVTADRDILFMPEKSLVFRLCWTIALWIALQPSKANKLAAAGMLWLDDDLQVAVARSVKGCMRSSAMLEHARLSYGRLG